MAKKRKRVDYDSPLMDIYSPEYQYLMRQNAPENANVAGLGDWLSNLFNRNKQQPDYHRDTVSMGLGTENSLQGVGNGGTDWNNQNFSLTGQSNQQQFNYNPNQELTTSQQYQNTLKDPENLAPKQTGEQSTQPSAGSNVNWGGVIGTAATATANAISNGGSAADIVANAMGIPVLAKMWKANTEKGDANIKSAQEAIASVQDNKYIQDANSLQGVGNALKLNMSNKPKMIDTSGFQRMTNWKDFSSGRGSGTWWKNMATAQLQGAASGSVGGPWGALGGATAGLLGSIGGLFGGKKRAKRAMNEYNQKMDSLRAYATAENLRRKTDYELSNQNAIHNGLGQQSIKEMSNFRAYGGNLFEDGGETPLPLTGDFLDSIRYQTKHPNSLTPEGYTLDNGAKVRAGDFSDWIEDNASWLNYLPFVGTLSDIDKTLADPTVGNAAWALTSLATDILPLGKVVKAFKGAKAAEPIADLISNGAERNVSTLSRPTIEEYNIIKKTLGNKTTSDIMSNIMEGNADGVRAATNNAIKKQIRNTFLANAVVESANDLTNYLTTQEQNEKPNIFKEYYNMPLGSDNEIISNTGAKFHKVRTSKGNMWVDETGKISLTEEEMADNLYNNRGYFNNTKAYGGNLYPDGGNVDFKSELDWSPESWFSKRVAKPDGTYYNEDEARILASHVPEYNQIEQTTKANGTWLKMPDGSTWKGDPRSWVMMQSKAFKDNYANIPFYTGQGAFPTQFDYGNGLINTDMVTALPYSNDQMWFSNNKNYGDAFAYYYASSGNKIRKNVPDEQDLSGHNFLAAIPKKGKYNSVAAPNGTADDWRYMPYDLVDGRIRRLKDSDIEFHNNYDGVRINKRKDGKTVLTDDVVNWSKDLGDDAIFLHNIDDGPAIYIPEGKVEEVMYRYNHNLPVNTNEFKIKTPILKEVITHPDFTKKVKFIEGNTGDFDINNPYKYSYMNFTNNNNIAAIGGQFDISLSPNMMNLWNDKQQIDQQKVNMQQMNFGLGNSFNQKMNMFPDGGGIDPYYPESQDPTAVNWLSDWYRQRPEQIRNTFYGSTYDMPNPNISGEYEELSDIPLDRTINPSRKFFDDSLYKNLIDRAATVSPVYRMDMPNTTLGEYSPSGQNIVTEDGVVNYPNAAHTISYNMKDVPAFANPDEDYYDKETLPLRIHENNHAITHGFDSVAKEINNRIVRKDGIEKDSYKDNPYEVHSYMMEFRNKAGLNPTDVITKDILNKHRKELKETNLDRYTDDSLVDLLNNVVDNNDMKRYSNVAAFGGGLDLSPNMMNLWNDKQNIDKQKIMNQQINFGLGNSFNQKLNTFDYGGSMNGMNLPTGMQYYENGGSHEENPNGGIQVGQDQQGNPNLVEEGEFRYGDYIFSDRIPVDYSILSDFNVEKGKGNRNTKNNPTYAELAKKTADKYKGLNDKISKDSLNKQLDRLQQSQEAQKFKEQQDQQYADYKSALKSPTQGNPMYGNMKYNGIGNANQGINAGVDEGISNAMDNSNLSNVNRSGNAMMAAYGGNIYKDGDEMSFIIPKSLLGSVRTPSLSYSTPMLNNFSSFVNVNSDKNINDNQSYEYLNNYFTPNQVADLRERYGLSRAGGIDTPFVKNVQKMIGVRRNGNFDDKSQLALNKFANYPTEDVVNPNNSQYGTTQSNSSGTSTSTKVATKTPTQVILKDENTSDENIRAINGNESAVNNTMAVSGKGPQETVEVDHDLGRPAAGISDYTDSTVPMYNDNGYWANLVKGIMPNLMNWSGQANWKFDPDWRPEVKLEALGKTAYKDRIADHLGDYIAPNLMDIERLNNASQAQTAANARAIQNMANGRATGLASLVANDYNGQMGIGNNYVTTNQYNADQLFKSAEFNKATNQFNATANNEAWRNNLDSWLQGKNMEINALVQANQARNQKAEYKDRVDRDAALNRSSDLGAMADNMINTVVDNALYNRGLNNINTKLNNRYYFDKDKGWTYKGDTGIGRQINEYAKDVRLTSDDYTQINNILKEDPHNIAGIEGIIDARRAEQDKQDIKDFNDKHNSIIADFDNYSNLLDDALFSNVYKNEDRLAFNKARDKYVEVINDKKSTSSQKDHAYNDFRNKVNQMKDKYSLYKGMVYSQRNKSFDLTPEEKDNKSAYGGKINTRKHREYSYTDI